MGAEQKYEMENVVAMFMEVEVIVKVVVVTVPSVKEIRPLLLSYSTSGSSRCPLNSSTPSLERGIRKE